MFDSEFVNRPPVIGDFLRVRVKKAFVSHTGFFRKDDERDIEVTEELNLVDVSRYIELIGVYFNPEIDDYDY